MEQQHREPGQEREREQGREQEQGRKQSVTLSFVAEQCVALVADNHGRQLDWSVDGLAELDAVCAELLADGPLAEQRLDLWWQLAGAYTGEVLVRVFGGEWTDGGEHSNGPAVRVLGLTAFPFNTAYGVLLGEESKSLASFARAIPAVARREGGRRD
ncbi:hypothetical protein [Streptomyces sp. TLI_171]|uniref:hypothetical protein n=1 Tax=Streptomyces sp. TLI_171 TaxID=1938859 RepID=UPI000C49595C|nr:hypothetical protein [Streptomyces sp. TLI_171]RKE17087.1 hypothetical protein BX266_0338 [Streptomyces sp. TLI_171]